MFCWRRWSAPAWASSGSTRRRPWCSWAIPARWRSAARWARSRSSSSTRSCSAIIGGLFVLEDGLGDRAGRCLQVDRQARFPHGAAAPSFRAEGLGRADHRHPLLDHRRHPGDGRSGHLEAAVSRMIDLARASRFVVRRAGAGALRPGDGARADGGGRRLRRLGRQRRQSRERRRRGRRWSPIRRRIDWSRHRRRWSSARASRSTFPKPHPVGAPRRARRQAEIICDIELLARAQPTGAVTSASPAPTANRRRRR